MAFTVQAGSVRTVVAGLNKAIPPAARRLTLVAMGEALHQRVRANASLRDHTLRDLARLGRPYARRHGTIRIHRDRPYLVHTHTGQLLRAVRAEVLPGSPERFGVWLDPTVAKHAAYVVLGTRVMLPRDLLMETAIERGTQVAMMRAAVNVLGKQLRTGAAVRFGAASGPAEPTGPQGRDVRGRFTSRGGALGV